LAPVGEQAGELASKDDAQSSLVPIIHSSSQTQLQTFSSQKLKTIIHLFFVSQPNFKQH
jgi:hypothetical protein